MGWTLDQVKDVLNEQIDRKSTLERIILQEKAALSWILHRITLKIKTKSLKYPCGHLG